jgi:cell division protein FtsX
MPIPLAPVLVALSGAMAVRALTSIGFGIVVIVGWQSIKDTIETLIDNNLTMVHPDVLAIISKMGFIDAIGIWLGALTALVTLYGMKRLMLIPDS